MSTMVEVIFSFRLLLPLLLGVAAAANVGIHGLEEKKALPLHKLQWGLEVSNVGVSSSKVSGRHKGAAVLQLKHHNHVAWISPHSNEEDDHHKFFLLDAARVSSLQSHLKHRPSGHIHAHASEAQIPLTSGVKLQTLNYIVDIALGNKKVTLIVDTGSDLTWVQCKPCLYCYNQQPPLFDPSSSLSYQTIPCNSTACDWLRPATGTSGNCGSEKSSCYYSLSYGDGSYTRGVLAQEKIELDGTIVNNFIFGCGRNNRGLFGGTSGIMGLGRTQLSLISQTLGQFGGIFSYCLPTMGLVNSLGSLILGDNTSLYRNTTPISYTRMISDPERAPFYFLNLTGVTIGGINLKAAGFANGKILIDSGTVITRLVPSVYEALKGEFLRQFSGYPRASGFSILDTCFDLSGYDEVQVPTMRLGMEGGMMVEVDVSGILYIVKKDGSQVCLAVTSLVDEDEVGIIGNYQQKNQRVVYDTIGVRLGFATEVCG